MKISKWGDLSGRILKTNRGLEVETILYCARFIPRVSLGERLIACIDWEADLKKVVDILSQLGFDVEYEKPFNLIEFLKESIQLKKYNKQEYNGYFWCKDNVIYFDDASIEIIGALYFTTLNNCSCNSIERILKENKVTPMQLKNAIGQLWMNNEYAKREEL